MAEHKPPLLSNASLAEAQAPLLRHRRELEAQIAEVNRVLSNLQVLDAVSMGTHSSSTPPIAAGNYVGRAAPFALEDYMRDRRGQKIPLDRIVSDLLIAGLEPGRQRGKKAKSPEETLGQNLKIALAQKNRNRALYEYSPPGSLHNVPAKDITVWLAAGADQPAKKRKK